MMKPRTLFREQSERKIASNSGSSRGGAPQTLSQTARPQSSGEAIFKGEDYHPRAHNLEPGLAVAIKLTRRTQMQNHLAGFSSLSGTGQRVTCRVVRFRSRNSGSEPRFAKESFEM